MGKRKCPVCAPNTCLDEPKPKRKRLDTRAAGLRQAARHIQVWAKALDEGTRQDALLDVVRELRVVARAEARRGGE